MPFMLWVSRRLNPKRRRYDMLAERLTALEDLLKQLADKPYSQPVIIHHADQVTVDKIDLSNHFGTMDIKSLEGQLNIGLNYRGPLDPDKMLPFGKDPCPSHPPSPLEPGKAAAPNDKSPKYNIRPRTEKDQSAHR